MQNSIINNNKSFNSMKMMKRVRLTLKKEKKVKTMRVRSSSTMMMETTTSLDLLIKI